VDKIGKYTIQETLGKGSMGLVYKALDPDIDRTVAIKVVHFDAATSGQDEENLRLRFMQEAKAAGRLCHPNIIAIYDIGREDGYLYIVMQYIEGKNLQHLLSAGRTFTPLESLNIIVPLCRALDYAHQNGVIHRDVKPGNIILDRNGQPFLADFGVAKLAQVNLTRSGLLFGTPGYISPEQFMGEKIDGRSDLFSLGVMLYVLLTGQEPFARKGMELTTIMKRILTAIPDPPSRLRPETPRGFDGILNKALAKKPEKRYQTGQQMALALETMTEEAGSTWPPICSCPCCLKAMDSLLSRRRKARKSKPNPERNRHRTACHLHRKRGPISPLPTKPRTRPPPSFLRRARAAGRPPALPWRRSLRRRNRPKSGASLEAAKLL
jgi:serine/threonine protein kinase